MQHQGILRSVIPLRPGAGLQRGPEATHDEGVRDLGRDRLFRPLMVLLTACIVTAPIMVPRWSGNAELADLFNAFFLLLGITLLSRCNVRLALPLGFSYLLILLGGMLAMTYSVVPADSILGIAQDIYLFLWFIVVVNLVARGGPSVTRTICSAWGIIAAFEGSLMWYLSSSFAPFSSIFGYPTEKAGGRALGTFRDPNMAGNYLVLSLFIVWAAPHRSRKTRVLLTGPILLGILVSQSNTAFVTLLAGTLVAITARFVARREAVVATALVILAAIVAAVLIFPSTEWRTVERTTESLARNDTFSLSLGRAGGSLGRRWQRWQDTLRFVGPNILVGIGPRSTDDALEQSGYTQAAEVHDDYLAGFVERGIIGGLGVLLFFATVSTWGLRLSFSKHLRDEGWSVAALTGGIMVILLSAITLETLHFRHVWMFLAVSIGLSLRHLAGGINVPMDPRRSRYGSTRSLTRSTTSAMDMDRIP